MILPFSQKLNNKPTYFVEKIKKAFADKCIIHSASWDDKIYTLNNEVYKECKPKLHTIRLDKSNRWKPDTLIHFVINNRSKNMMRFLPVLKCTFTQNIKIHYWYNPVTQQFDKPSVYVDNKELTRKQINTLAVNDGFNNRAEFFEYFINDFEGKIIHWTNLMY